MKSAISEDRPKKNKLEIIKAMFRKKKVLQIKNLFRLLKTSSTNKGSYYTLKEIAEFDANGLWHYEDIGFSKYGTLFETIRHFVESSEDGRTNCELQNQSRTVVKHALLDLVLRKKLSRANPGKLFGYLSSDPVKAEEQLKKRKDRLAHSFDDSIALRVLLVAYQLLEGSVTPEQVAHALKKEGSKISLGVVQQVFRQYDLEKKTTDSSSCKR
jgi:hypothetical protein